MTSDDTRVSTLFHPLVWSWFSSRFQAPTEIQRLAWPRVAAGEHVLFTAPTGTGKTLAAFLWALNQLAAEAWETGGIRVLYVSPLKALNNDIRRNLFAPLAGIRASFEANGRPMPEIRVLTRSGDTPQSERRRMLTRPPEILITTPESLNLLLASPRARELLTGLRTVILDEIHAVAAGKRGTHLITAVDRLVPLCGEFQRIAVSATVRPLDRVAAFVGGYRLTDAGYRPRTVATIEAPGSKRLALRVEFPLREPRVAERDSVWHGIAGEIRTLIAAHASTLIFVNSRQLAEKIAARINEEAGELIAYAHHGSLSRELRHVVEKRLKAGELSAIVATSSLEMGIDIGDLELVVMVQSPFSISAAVQRIGRAGHSVGLESRGILFPTHGRDLLDAAVLARLVLDQEVEELTPVLNPLDVLAQVIVSMIGVESWNIDELYDFIRTSAPFRTLRRREFDSVLEMLAGRYEETRIRELKPRISIDRVEGVAAARPGALQVVYSSGGTIPDRGYFKLRLEGSQAVIGELDEEFVWERKVGETFALGTQAWKITRIDHQKVEVAPWKGPARATVFWKAEAINRDFHLSSRIGSFLETWNDSHGGEHAIASLLDRSSFSPEAADALSEFLAGQRAHTGTDLPHRHHVLAEHTVDPTTKADMQQVFIHTLWGNRVNYPLALALSAVWHDIGVPLDISSDNDCIHIVVPHAELFAGNSEASGFEVPVGELLDRVAVGDILELVRSGLERSGFFGARFRENAARALLLPRAAAGRRTPLWLNRLKAKNLMQAVSAYRNFPIMLETWRACVQDEFDLESLRLVLDEVRSGEIAVTEVATLTPSPFAAGSIWTSTNELMYADDTPKPGQDAAVDTDLLREAVFDAGIRPALDRAIVEELRRKLHRVFEGYAPAEPRELVDWAGERLLIPETEWSELLAAVDRDGELDAESVLQTASSRLARVRLPGAGGPAIASVESLARIVTAFGLDLSSVAAEPVGPGADAAGLRAMTEQLLAGRGDRNAGRSEGAAGEPEAEDAPTASPEDLLAQWLSFYGPVPVPSVQRVFGLGGAEADDLLGALADSGEAILDSFHADSACREVCDARNLERILALQRRRARPAFEPAAAERIPLFLAAWQRLTNGTAGEEGLKRCLEQLMGYPAKAAAWEEALFPARVPGYRGRMLEELLQNTDLEWFGCGKERTSFCFAADSPLFAAADSDRDRAASSPGPEEPGPASAGGDADDRRDADPEDAAALLLPDAAARYTFWDIHQRAGMDTRDLTERLWAAVWDGAVRCDTYETVRRAAMSGFTPEDRTPPPSTGRSGWARGGRRGAGFAGWKASRPLLGTWYRVPAQQPADLLEQEELNKDRVRFLLKRYGVLFRELLSRELPAMRWASLFRTMRIMELGGELLAGHFFDGVTGLQFASHAALRLLREGLPDNAVYWMNAADPASLCGVGIEDLRPVLPERYPSTCIVFHGVNVVLVSRKHGEVLEVRVPPEHGDLRRYLECLSVSVNRDYNPRTSVKVKLVNGESVEDSGYGPGLEAAGFRRDYQGYSLWSR